MAVIHVAELSPSKPEALAAWVPRQSWFAGDPTAVPEVLGQPRLDDPDGEVGIETFLVRFGDGPVLQVPMTYRAAPLGGVEPAFLMEHSVLGRRFVYDGAVDPVAVATIVATIAQGGSEAELVRDGEHLPSRGRLLGVPVEGAVAVTVANSGVLAADDRTDGTTVIAVSGGSLQLRRRPPSAEAVAGRGPVRPQLLGCWPQGPMMLLAEIAAPAT